MNDLMQDAITIAHAGILGEYDVSPTAVVLGNGETGNNVQLVLGGFRNEEDAEKVFGISAPEADVTGGKVAAAQYRYVCERLAERFPNLKTIAITRRGSISASHNTWSGALWTREGAAFYSAPVYDIVPIVDHVGGGDSFVGGLIYGLRRWPADPGRALRFAVAASCLKHSIPGDFNAVTVAEVEALMAGDVSGRVRR